MAVQRQFKAWDYVVFSFMLAFSSAIGVFYACRSRNRASNKEFLMADRQMTIIPVALSILVSFTSAILILGTPAELYMAGTQYVMSMFGVFLAIATAALIFVPLFYPLKMTSSFEYLERRFKYKPAKVIGTLILVVQQVLYMGIATFAPSTALEAVTGFPVWATVIIVGLVSTFYTTLGGIKAVVWTDVFQAMVMVAGLLAIVIEGVIQVGSIEQVWDINNHWKRIEFFDFDPDPTQRHTFWTLVVGSMVGWTATYGCNQTSVQRFCTLPTLAKARMCVLLNIVGIGVLLIITYLAGLVVFAYYAQRDCDPLSFGFVSNSNQIIPYFVMEVLNLPGLPGLFVSCLFSGALSSMSSSINALAAVTWEDFLKDHLDHRLTEEQKTWVTKALVLVYGAAGIGMAFMARGLGGTVLQASLSFTGAASGPLLGLFLLGALFPWANGYGAVVGGVLGLALPLWISFGAYDLPPVPIVLPLPSNNGCLPLNATTTTTITTITTAFTTAINTTTVSGPAELSGLDLLYTVSYLWYPAIGAATVVIVGLVVSFITGPMSIDEVDPKYLIPIFDRLFCCLPASFRRILRCNRDFPSPEEIMKNEEASKECAAENGQKIQYDDPCTLEKPASDNNTSTKTPVDTQGSVVSVISFDSGRGSAPVTELPLNEDISQGKYTMTTHL